MQSLRVLAGEVERSGSLVRAPLPDGTASGPVALKDETSGRIVPAQADSGSLAFVLADPLPAGESRTFSLTDEQPPDSGAATFVAKLDRVELLVGNEPFATYVIAGGRRPYFWPVLGPSGASVVRGQGSADHPHHTGLAVSYGGHGEGGSVNIWSDWDEPPYGPGGRMLHTGFRRLVSGPVYGELVQDLTYVDAHGDPFAVEVRTIRWWWADRNRRFLDLDCRVLEVTDAGTKPFIMMVRTPECFGIPGTGRVTNSADAAVPEMVYSPENYYHAAWTDASGPTGGPPPPPPAGPPEELPDLQQSSAQYREVGTGPWNGIALLDHPGNGGYPNIIGKYAMVQQVTQAHYPPADAPQGPFSFRSRLYIHDGDADAAGVRGVAADYQAACEVEIG
ncbi:MAG TPA: DUF6807 family protein [Mycobacteriales bacterium]|nr:DUF6807 family protein [Mycobacteriales bacterium]